MSSLSPEAAKFQEDKARIKAKMIPAALLAFSKMPPHLQNDIVMYFVENRVPFIIDKDDLIEAWMEWNGIVGYTEDLKALFNATGENRPQLPTPEEWSKIVAALLVKQGVSISRAFAGTTDTIEAQRHESRVKAEMRRLGAQE